MKEKTLGFLAVTLLALGGSGADSEYILIPFMMTLAGVLLLLRVCHK